MSTNQSSLEKRLAHADPRYLLAAIVDIYDLWDEELGKKPGAEHWATDSRFYRPQMCDAVTQRWCEITGHDTPDFPFHHDFVAAAWVMFRKESNDRKDSVRRTLMTFVA